jgi:hypothetical protein
MAVSLHLDRAIPVTTAARQRQGDIASNQSSCYFVPMVRVGEAS